jgi:hypothetical protein
MNFLYMVQCDVIVESVKDYVRNAMCVNRLLKGGPQLQLTSCTDAMNEDDLLRVGQWKQITMPKACASVIR